MIKKEYRISAAVLMVVTVILLPAFVQAKTSLTDITTIERIKPKGEFAISVFKDGKWQDAGKLSFNQFFRQRD